MLTFGLTNIPSGVHNTYVQNQNRLAAEGEARLLNKEMPSDLQLKAMGMSKPEALGKLVMLNLDQFDDAVDGDKPGEADARDKLTGIQHREIIKLQNGFARFPDGDPLNSNVKMVTPLDGYFDVAMHGTSTAVCFGTENPNMSPRMLANMILHSDGYDGQNIRLLSCSTGKSENGEYCFAEELANILGVDVTAPNMTLYISEQGYFRVGKFNEGEFVTYTPNQRRRIR